MKVQSLKRAIEQRGGNARIERTVTQGMFEEIVRVELFGNLNNHDIHLNGGRDGESTFYTVRQIKDRGHYDPGSDYNSGGYSFYHKLNELDYIAGKVVA